MVDAVVSFVVQRLGDLLIEQAVSLRGVEDDVRWLKSTLDMMSCFLRDAEEKQDEDHRVRNWISDIRDVAYDAEDIIDNFILRVEEGKGTLKKMAQKDCLRKYFCIGSKYGSLIEQANLCCIGKEIDSLKKRLEEINRNREIFNIREISDGRGRSGRRNERLICQIRTTRPYEDDEFVVGFEKDVAKLMFELVKEVKHRCVISIAGMGGLGKTTIARKLYNNNSLRDKFDCYAWVPVSKDYNIKDLLQKIIKSFNRPTRKEEFEILDKMEVDDLESRLRKDLEECCYLVVIDDVWDVNVWPSLRRALPDNKNGSRVIVTTRSKTVAEHCDRPYVHELPFLNKEESWELFCKKAFLIDDEVGGENFFCPPGLEGLAREMVSKCGGLPLALVVLGGLLHRKHPDEWFKLKDQMWRHIEEDSVHVRYILELSFNDLPHHLKSCFLYLSLFPEDYEIDSERLCWLWEAEGFTNPNVEPFEMAYLQQLIDRSLILVTRRNWRRIVTCRVHDLIRDLAIQKSKELNFLHIYDETGRSLLPPCSRRLALHNGFQRFVSLVHSEMRFRMLLCFNCFNLNKSQLQHLCKKLRLLRVLNFVELGGSRREMTLPDQIGKLIHLRYLGLGLGHINGPYIGQLPPSIGKLHALQTLDLGDYGSATKLPDEIRTVKQLRHLIGMLQWPFPVDNLTKLQTLRSVVVDGPTQFDPTGLINLRELGLKFWRSHPITLDLVGGLRSLQALSLRMFSAVSFPALQPLSGCPKLFQIKLVCRSAFKVPEEVHQFLPNLKYLLIDAPLTEDPMPALEKLPNLTILVLESYSGSKLACSAGGFPLLEILIVSGIDPSMRMLLVEGRAIRIEGGAMPMLEVEGGAMPMLKGFQISHIDVHENSDWLHSITPPPSLDDKVWPYSFSN